MKIDWILYTLFIYLAAPAHVPSKSPNVITKPLTVVCRAFFVLFMYNAMAVRCLKAQQME